MKAGEKNFMAVVDLLHAKESIEKAIEELKTKLELGAVHHMRFSMHKIADAMEKVYRDK